MVEAEAAAPHMTRALLLLDRRPLSKVLRREPPIRRLPLRVLAELAVLALVVALLLALVQRILAYQVAAHCKAPP